jgi:site-specific recombinase XerD
VPEFDWVVDILKHWLSPAGRELFPTADRSRSLWPSERSGNASLRAFERAFTRARIQAGLPEELTLHCLRHSYVPHLIEADYDAFFVQQQVGHQNASTTSLYTSVSSDFKQRTIQQMITRRLRLDDQEG